MHVCAHAHARALYHKTVVVVNARSARVTEGVPINNTLSQRACVHMHIARFTFLMRRARPSYA